MDEDETARRGPMPILAAPAPHVGWRGIGPQHCVQIRRAVQDAANAASREVPTVLVCGDSTSLEAGNDSLGMLDTAYGLILRKIRQDNPGVAFRFVNRGIGGNTWGHLNSRASGKLPAWYAAPAEPWIAGHIAPAGAGGTNPAPDLVIILMGTNDNANMGLVSPAGVLAKFADTSAGLFPVTPDLWLATSTGRTRDPAHSSAEQSGGALLAASTTRLIALGGHGLLANAGPVYPRPIGLLDFGRMWAQTTLGFDPVRQHFRGLSAGELHPYRAMRARGTEGFLLPPCDGDFDATAVFPGQAATLLAGRAMRIGIGAPMVRGKVRSAFLCQMAGGRMNVAWRPGIGTVSFGGTAVPLGGGDVTLRIIARGNDAVLSVNGVTCWDGRVVRGHGRFRPRIWFGADGADDLLCDLVAYRAGEAMPTAPTMDDHLAWGEHPVGIRGRTGGNQVNHPSSLYMREVVDPVLEAESLHFGT